MYYGEDVLGGLGVLLLIIVGVGVHGYNVLSGRLRDQQDQIDNLREQLAWGTPPPRADIPPHPAARPSAQTPVPQAPQPQTTEPPEPQPARAEAVAPGARVRQPMSASTGGTGSTPPPGGRGPTPPPSRPAGGLEQNLASRWLIWLGGAALAAAGIFFGQYVIEQGLVGPMTRMLLGLFAGMCLVLAGEWLTRHPPLKAIGTIDPQYIPAALSAGGIVAAYASAYAGYTLAGLMAPWLAFIVLAVIANGSIGLALRQGPLLAAIGLIGAYVMPALVSTGSHQPWVLFPYLFLVTVAGLTVVTRLAWRWLTWLCIGAAWAWVYLWQLTSWIPSDIGPVALYLALIIASLDVVQRAAGPVHLSPAQGFGWAWTARPAERYLSAAMVLNLIALFALLRLEHYATHMWIILAAFLAHALWIAWKRPAMEILVPLAALTILMAVSGWHQPHMIDLGPQSIAQDALSRQLYTPIIPPALLPFITVSGLFALAFVAAGAVGGRTARTPWMWAAVAAGLALLLLALAEGRFAQRGLELAWSLPALGLAGLFGGLAWDAVKHRQRPGGDGALAAWMIGLFAALAFAVNLHLDQAWLAVSLAVLTAATAWTGAVLRLAPLRWLAAVFTLLSLAGLLVNNPDLWRLRGDVTGFANLAYMYGFPALAFIYANRQMRRQGDDRLALLVRLAGGASIMALAGFSIRLAVADGVTGDYSLLEAGLQGATWTAASLRLHQRNQTHPDRVVDWSWKFFATLAAVNLVAFQVILLNPLLTNDPIGAWPIVNHLLVGYALAAVMAGLLWRSFDRAGRPLHALLAGAAGLVAAFIWLNMEVRHGFHGARLGQGATGNGEWFAYSVAWLAYGGALLALGLWRDIVILRWVSMAVILLTVAKVFLLDLSELSGLYRVFSFFGLGLSLVGVGYLYQRFVFPRAQPAEAEGG